jgi:hypothetical protein
MESVCPSSGWPTASPSRHPRFGRYCPSEPEMMCSPLGEYATEVMQCQCALLQWLANCSTSLSVPHSNGLVTRYPEMMCCPLGNKQQRLCQELCPSSGWPTAAPVSASQIRMMLLPEPETMHCPLGEQATEFIRKCAPPAALQPQHQSQHPRSE